jgi:hypothetical protein
MIRILASSGPINIVIPSAATANTTIMSVSSRYAHDLYLYHRLAVNIVTDQTALQKLEQGDLNGNIVSIGGAAQNRFTSHLMEYSPHTLRDTPVRLAGREFEEIGTGKPNTLSIDAIFPTL